MSCSYLLITCEHGGNRIPLEYSDLFRSSKALLETHRGWDPGALMMARDLARELTAPLVVSTVSRLLIDLNRSIGHKDLYSEATRAAPAGLRQGIVKRYYLPYRTRAEGLVRAAVADGRRVIHISSHSFTPELHGEVRNADIGLLYDPVRPGEADLAKRWQAAFSANAPALKVRRNYPYAGKADGLTNFFRQCFALDAYIGIELEINQKHVGEGRRAGRRWTELRGAVISALQIALNDIN
ncbi:MAG: N-formylglutamate amidohydrolase [Burkholderiales bacterium]|nr:N-formylglutamate amidohydrolase [Burkholderiales bacterium]